MALSGSNKISFVYPAAEMKILILGVTASGKGRLAFDLGCEIGAEIISVDSMKVYRRMDIGTAKPSVERQGQVKYPLIALLN